MSFFRFSIESRFILWYILCHPFSDPAACLHPFHKEAIIMRASLFPRVRLQIEALENRDCPSLTPIATGSPPISVPTGPGQTQNQISLPTLGITPPALANINGLPSLPGSPGVPLASSINFATLESEIVAGAGAFAKAHGGAGLTGNLSTTINKSVTAVHYSESKGNDSLTFDVVVGPSSASIKFTEHVGNEVIRFGLSETTQSAVFFITDVVGHKDKFYSRESVFTPHPVKKG
jgi:hypothetical protein